MAAEAVVQHNATVLKDLVPGDMVEFPRGMYSHWGVYIGDDKIIHLSGGDNDGINANLSASSNIFTICGRMFDKAFVCEDDFWKVVLGCKAKRNNSKDRKLTPLSGSQIVHKAKSMLGEIGYNVLWHNCEHFAAFCRYGEKWSEQADKAITNVMIMGSLVAVGGMIWAAFKGNEDKEKD